MQNLNSQTIQLVIVAAVAVTMLLQAFALLAIFVTLRKSVVAMRADIDEMRSSVVPVVERVGQLLAHTSPKVEAVVEDLAALSQNLRKQSADVQNAANEVIERMRRQSARVDAMLTGILDVVDRATGFMSDAVSKPMRQLAGLLASAKAVVESLRSETHEPHAPHDQSTGVGNATGFRSARGDKDMYI